MDIEDGARLQESKAEERGEHEHGPKFLMSALQVSLKLCPIGGRGARGGTFQARKSHINIKFLVRLPLRRARVFPRDKPSFLLMLHSATAQLVPGRKMGVHEKSLYVFSKFMRCQELLEKTARLEQVRSRLLDCHGKLKLCLREREVENHCYAVLRELVVWPSHG